MKHSSIRQKGQRLEREVAAMLEDKLGITATRMAGSGAFHLKGDVYIGDPEKFPWTVECKNNEAHKIWQEWKQAESQATGNKKPLLIISGNHRPVLAVVRVEDLIDLQAENNDLWKEKKSK
jgi:hypothetical protein